MAVGSFGIVVGVAIVLIDRASPPGRTEPRETRLEATWRWLEAAIMGVTVLVAVFAGLPLVYVFGLVGVLALTFTAVNVVIGVRAARRLDGQSEESGPP